MEHPTRACLAEIVVTDPAGVQSRGSGYRVDAGWVLTAAHVVHGAARIGVWFGAPSELRAEDMYEVDAADVRCIQRMDLALLPVPAAPAPQGFVPPLFGALDRDSEVEVPSVAPGFPHFKLRPAPGREGVELRDVHYAIARIVGGSNLPSWSSIDGSTCATMGRARASTAANRGLTCGGARHSGVMAVWGGRIPLPAHDRCGRGLGGVIAAYADHIVTPREQPRRDPRVPVLAAVVVTGDEARGAVDGLVQPEHGVTLPERRDGVLPRSRWLDAVVHLCSGGECRRLGNERLQLGKRVTTSRIPREHVLLVQVGEAARRVHALDKGCRLKDEAAGEVVLHYRFPVPLRTGHLPGVQLAQDIIERRLTRPVVRRTAEERVDRLLVSHDARVWVLMLMRHPQRVPYLVQRGGGAVVGG